MSRSGTGARDQVARLLTLVPLLHARGDLPVAEAAAVLGTTPQQVVKDLKVLWMCGLPGGYPDDLIDIDMDALTAADGDGTIRVWNADYLARPVRLSRTEATALIVALRTLRDGTGQESRAVIERALAKLEDAAANGAEQGPAESVAVSDAPDGGQTSHVAAVLREAAASGVQVSLDYWVPTRDERTRRSVDPHRVRAAGGVLYLEGYCHVAQAPRVFRVDRILDIEVLPDAVTTRPEDDAPAAGEGVFVAGDDAPLVTLLLDRPARWVASYYQVQDARERADGSLEVDIVVQSPEWLTSLLLRLAPHARPLDPDHGRRAAAEAASALAHYA